MFGILSNRNRLISNNIDFAYLDPKVSYFDSACTTLRPQSVIDSEVDYYKNYNSCGHRVRYSWGKKTDQKVDSVRQKLLDLVGKSETEYTVAFCLNTTSGINQVLHQLPGQNFQRIVTSEIEHNSVFLPTITWAEKNQKPRIVLERERQDKDQFGSLKYSLKDLQKAVVLLNTSSNIDGSELLNISQLAKDVHNQEGVLLLDSCQTFGQNPELLKDIDFEACFGSGHKMYGPSLGFIIIKKSFLMTLEPFLIGGSTVQKVNLESYELIENPQEIYARIEPGLQNYGGIIGLGTAVDWRQNFNQKIDGKIFNAREYKDYLSKELFEGLSKISNLKTLNPNPSPVVSLYLPKTEGHRIAAFLNEEKIYARSGYHCCHYFLHSKLKLPPLFRLSLGLNNDINQIQKVVTKLDLIAKNFG